MDDGEDLNPPRRVNHDQVDARIKASPMKHVTPKEDGDSKASRRSGYTTTDSDMKIPPALNSEKVVADPECMVYSGFVFSNPKGKVAPTYTYATNCPHRGICLVISVDQFDPQVDMPDRQGAGEDVKNIGRAFTQLDFECRYSRNITATQMRRLMQDIANLDHSDMDCFACVILTHGENNGILYARDRKINLEDLLAPFKGDKCPSLAGKPKLFFLQACRGDKLDEGTLVTDSAPGEDETDAQQSYKRIPTEADFLLAFSVIPGYFSWRNSQRGSWFIQALTEMLQRYGRELDLLSILTRVSHKVAYEFESNAGTAAMSRKKQIPCIMSMLTKNVYFPPKLDLQ